MTMSHSLRYSFGVSSSLNAVVTITLLIVIGIVISGIQAQENAQTRIPISLAECYENPAIYERDNRLPATINTLIELIRKIEDTPGYTQDLRQVVTSILHRFRLDGIERAPGVFQQSVLPFSPSGYQFSKHRLLLSRLIPGNAFNFPNNTLTTVERCTLHFLISTSIETQIRGDEATRCGQLAQYRAQRIPMDRTSDNLRIRRSVPTKSNFLGDVELMDDFMQYRLTHREHKKVNRYSAIGNDTDEDDNNEDGITDDDIGDDLPDVDFGDSTISGSYGLVDVASNAISQCPVENGVVRTTWGSVSIGPLLAGIAAGVVQQSVTTRELLMLTRSYSNGRHGGRQQTMLSIDNRWAATLAGDLAEVALLQGPMTRDVRVGASGAWNSTAVPRWYFLSQRERLEMTDAEIRGDIDGLVLALHIQEWRNQASQLRLSQVLDMYYSQRGIFSSDIKSCNRRNLFTKFAVPAQLQAQTTAFSTVLDREMQLRVTLSNDAIRQFSNAAVQALTTHVANGLNDVTCEATNTPNDLPRIQTATDLHIFIDASWQFFEIHPVIATLLENLEVNRFGSRITLYNANDASLVVNTTSGLSEFYTQWNASVHQQLQTGLSLPNIVKQLRTIGQAMLENDRINNSVGGRSFVSLIVPQMTGVSDSDSNYAREQIIILREIVPDLTILFLSGGSHTRFENFVRDRERDLFPLTSISSGPDSGQQVLIIVQPVIQRIQFVPRRIINPRCDSNWQQIDWGSNTMEEFVAPGTINYYRLHPNYFFQSGGFLRIQGRGYAHISVCSSRWVERPRQSNSSQQQDNVNCRQLLPTDNFDIELTNGCHGFFLIQDCPPFFISVEGVQLTGQNNFRCTEPECRYPDSIRYGITVENLGCFSGAIRTVASTTVIIVILLNLLVLFRH